MTALDDIRTEFDQEIDMGSLNPGSNCERPLCAVGSRVGLRS